MPWLKEAADLLAAAEVNSAKIAGELFVHYDQRRPHVHDVSTIARNPKSQEDLQRLRFAPFDIVEIDGQAAGENYAGTFQSLESLFGKSQYNQPVETQVVSNVADIYNLFEKWVAQEGAEGLVARSDGTGVFKVKPRHAIDAVVVGFTESSDDRQGMLHDILVAVMRADGSLHILTRVGGGFSRRNTPFHAQRPQGHGGP